MSNTLDLPSVPSIPHHIRQTIQVTKLSDELLGALVFAESRLCKALSRGLIEYTFICSAIELYYDEHKELGNALVSELCALLTLCGISPGGDGFSRYLTPAWLFPLGDSSNARRLAFVRAILSEYK